MHSLSVATGSQFGSTAKRSCRVEATTGRLLSEALRSGETAVDNVAIAFHPGFPVFVPIVLGFIPEDESDM